MQGDAYAYNIHTHAHTHTRGASGQRGFWDHLFICCFVLPMPGGFTWAVQGVLIGTGELWCGVDRFPSWRGTNVRSSRWRSDVVNVYVYTLGI
jgi:hypothetical protein